MCCVFFVWGFYAFAWAFTGIDCDVGVVTVSTVCIRAHTAGDNVDLRVLPPRTLSSQVCAIVVSVIRTHSHAPTPTIHKHTHDSRRGHLR